MRKLFPLMLVMALLVLASACGKEPPDAELQAAKAAVADAQASGAATNCPDKLKAAEDKLAEAEAQYAAEEYDQCKATCLEVQKLAEIAKNCPPPVVATPPQKLDPPKKTPLVKSTDKIFFDTDKYNIRKSEMDKAKKYAEAIKSGWDKSFTVEGYCDERGSEEYNLALGDRRANTVKKYFVTMGLKADNVKTKSFGEGMAVDKGNNELAWAKNRRVEFAF
ncbi:MAG: OmpA family protein [Deltaproteobacteria bacterium]|nr:OmpA family protein [Deltaproteobacteria bacterium]